MYINIQYSTLLTNIMASSTSWKKEEMLVVHFISCSRLKYGSMFTLEWTSFQEVSELQFSLFSEQIKSAIESVLQKDEHEPHDSRLSMTLSGLTSVVELECKDCSEHMLFEQRAFAIALMRCHYYHYLWLLCRERHVLLIISEKCKVSDMIIASQPK